jgi:stress-induced morphogen
MTVKLRVKRPDPILRQIVNALGEYEKAHPKAEIEAYRQNSVSVRIRILSPEFAGTSRAQREEDVWAVLNKLPDEVVAEISLLLLLTPDEAKNSFASSEFDDPIPSRL